MLEEHNPLRDQVEQELQASEWFRKFKTWGLFLETLKTKIPITQKCDVRWITSTDELVIRCPNSDVQDTLLHHTKLLEQMAQGPAQRIIVRHADDSDLIFESS